MPRFGRRSLATLEAVHPFLRQVAHRTIEVVDFSVTDGHRDQQAQDAAFQAGRSKLIWPYSLHNREPAEAVHFVPYPIDWGDDELRRAVAAKANSSVRKLRVREYAKVIGRFYLLAGIIVSTAQFAGVSLRWGGDWDGDFEIRDQTFDDLAHFELS